MELKRKCLPLIGIRSLRALNAFSALLLGMKMMPGQAHLTYEEWITIVAAMEPEDQLKTFIHAAKFVALDPEEVKSLVCFCTDKNGIAYTEANVKTLTPSDLIEVIATVSMEIVQNIHIDLVHEEEKKNLSHLPLTSAARS